MSISIVSTFSNDGYHEYAKFFIDSLVKYLDREVKVFLYLDSVKIPNLPNNFAVIDFEKTVPELKEFRERNSYRTFKNFLSDGIRFSYKSYAWCHAGLNLNTDKLIWLDADTELINPVSVKYLNSKIPDEYLTSYLGRSGTFSETGWVAWNLKDPSAADFFQEYKKYYDTDKLYTLPFYTDCHVYDAVRNYFEQEKGIQSLNLSPPKILKNHFSIIFENYLYHYKGNRISKRGQVLSRRKDIKE